MTYLRIANETRNRVLGDRIELAGRLLKRLRGFLLRPRPEAGEGILLTPCQGVHMYGMRYPLDILFLARDGSVLALFPELPPGARTPLQKGARYALEVPPGTIEESRTQVGDLLTWQPTPTPPGSHQLP